VLEDIWSEILATTAPAETEAEISWQQAERNALEDYIEDRTRDFIGRGEVLSRLEDLASAPTREGAAWGLCLTAPPGSGKSAIFGEVHRRLKQNGVFVLAHAGAASARTASVDDMLRRWIEELGAALGTNPGLADNADPDTLDATFLALLNRMANERRVVVLVDALDQFEATTRGQFATWLPRLWPANARLIATAVPCEASTALEARPGVEPLALPPLDADEARRIAEAICARYHRTLEPEVLEALLAKRGEAGPAWGNTLWLVLAVEELNLVDGDDFRRATRSYTGAIAEQLRALMLDIVANLPSDVLGLYTESFERAEKLFGASLAQAFLGFIAISRAGWRESDFRVLLPRATGKEWDELHFASLRRLFRGQVRQRGAMGQWDVNHAQMRAAIRQYLRGRSIAETKLHAFAAQHLLLSLSADDPLRQSETMVHLLGSEDWLLAAEFYGGASLTLPELEGATRVLADAILTSRQAGERSGLDQVLNILRAAGQISDNRAAVIAGYIAGRLQTYLETMLAERGELSSRAILLEAVRKTFDRLAKVDPGNARWQRALSVSLDCLGNAQMAQGNLSEALSSYRQSQAISERLAKAYKGYSEWQRYARSVSSMSISQEKIGDILRAQGNLTEALSSYRQSRGIFEFLAEADPANAGWQHHLSVSLYRIGDVLRDQGNLAEALSSYKQSRDIAERPANADPGNAGWQHGLSVSLVRIGDVWCTQGNLSEALSSYRQSQEILERLAKADPGNTRWQRELACSLASIGNVWYAQGDVHHTFSGHGSDSGIFRSANHLSEALSSYRQSQDIVERLVTADASNAEWQRDLSTLMLKIGDVLQKWDMIESLVKEYPANAELRRDLSAPRGKTDVLLQGQGILTGALFSYRKGQDIIEHLVRADPGNAGWQRDLSVSYLKIGDVLVAQDNLSEAFFNYRQSQDIVERLARSDPNNAEGQRDLALGFERLATVKMLTGAEKDAQDLFRQGRDIIARLKAQAPDNANLSNDLERFDVKLGVFEFSETSVAKIFDTGDQYMQRGEFLSAVAAYRSTHAILDQLPAAHPMTAKWKGRLWVSYDKIGDAYRAQANLLAALEAYQAASDVAERLAKAAPEDPKWPQTLCISHYKIGELLHDAGNLPVALAAYEASLALFEKWLKNDTHNIEMQYNMSMLQERMGDAHNQQRDRAAALAAHQGSQKIRRRLIEIVPGNSGYLYAFGVSCAKIADIHRVNADLPAAYAAYQAAREAFNRLVKIDASYEGVRHDIARIIGQMAAIRKLQGAYEDAVVLFRQGRDIIAKLKAASPDNALLSRDAVWFDSELSALER
jgi:tetratricopeptide (TPR) repeat protein